MNEFALSGKDVFEVLKQKNIEFIYHANTVLTSITYIKENALLSRAFVEENNLLQSTQKSDLADKKYDVWDSVFIDGFDLHKKYQQANKYGPVLFRLKLELLLSTKIESIFITKNNPLYWSDKESINDWYYNTIDGFKNDYLIGKKLDSRIMLTIRKPERKINLKEFLHSIELDYPKLLINSKISGQKNLGEYAMDLLRDVLNQNALSEIPILIRHATGIGYCFCAINYNQLRHFNIDELKRRFNPQI